MKPDAKKQASAKRRAARRSSRMVTWIVGLGIAALVVYGVSQLSNIAYDDEDIAVVDFSDMTAKQKRTALEEANTARCTCGCGLTLAQCVATDATCPLREGNIDKIKGMVAEAKTQ